VIPKTPRAFPDVLARAQRMLRHDFGMELYELRAKQKGPAEMTQATQKRKGKEKQLDAVEEEDEGSEEGDGEGNETSDKRARGERCRYVCVLSLISADSHRYKDVYPSFGPLARTARSHVCAYTDTAVSRR
jgi:hypothetical protein